MESLKEGFPLNTEERLRLFPRFKRMKQVQVAQVRAGISPKLQNRTFGLYQVGAREGFRASAVSS